MSKAIYKDCCGTYSITVKSDGTAVLKCSNVYGQRWHDKTYKSEKSAKIALGKLCGGLPAKLN